ncbi:MAG: transposase [Paracoccus denitrificans]|nr:MAG: transposase [Paracoccus denitrificans]PZO85204.1 MAG: transposase [Paracoccus denitrificans]
MSRYLRPRRPGVPIFFTVVLAQRGSRLLIERVDALREAVRATRAERPFGIDAWVVLPDHLHCIWTLPPGDCDYSVRWGAIKARFSRAVRGDGGCPAGAVGQKGGGVNPTLRASLVRKGEVGIWQRRFYEHHIRDGADFAAHVEYCRWNPVKHGFVTRPEDWPYSLVRRDA